MEFQAGVKEFYPERPFEVLCVVVPLVGTAMRTLRRL